MRDRVCLVICSPLGDADLDALGQSEFGRRIDCIVSHDRATAERAALHLAPSKHVVLGGDRLTAELLTEIDAVCFVDTRQPVEWDAMEAACSALETQADVDAVKCSRAVLKDEPRFSLYGGLRALLLKGASGYWRLTDPEYGLIALRAGALPELGTGRLDKVRETIPLLCDLGLRQIHMLHLEFVESSARFSRSGPRDRKRLGSLIKLFLRRVAVQYFVLDVNLATIHLLLGAALLTGALCFGAFEWYQSSVTGIPRSAGTVMLALLPLLMGVQLVLNAILYDVQLASEVVSTVALSSQARSEP